MKKNVLRLLLIAVAVGFSIYLSDYAIFRFRVATGHRPYGTVTIRYYYAIQEKNGKTEYDFQPPQPETCANALFPHSGYRPCWYEIKHPEKAITI